MPSSSGVLLSAAIGVVAAVVLASIAIGMVVAAVNASRLADPLVDVAERAARIANAFADHYLRAQLTAKFDANAQANTFLGARLEDLRRQVEIRMFQLRGHRGHTRCVSSRTLPTNSSTRSASGTMPMVRPLYQLL
mgnify:CR=1 FL=1